MFYLFSISLFCCYRLALELKLLLCRFGDGASYSPVCYTLSILFLQLLLHHPILLLLRPVVHPAVQDVQAHMPSLQGPPREVQGAAKHGMRMGKVFLNNFVPYFFHDFFLLFSEEYRRPLFTERRELCPGGEKKARKVYVERSLSLICFSLFAQERGKR